MDIESQSVAKATVLSTYGMAPVIPLQEGIYTADNNLPDPELIVGVELEVEHWRGGGVCMGFTYEADGSLRNNGIEGITVPVRTKHLRDMLEVFMRVHNLHEDNYSERCSTHVHMNVQDATIEEVRVISLLYQIFERLLFKYVGHDREENIFCVPWYQSGLTPSIVDKMVRNVDSVARNWIKYSALNLLPMREKGTIEFRHLYGTCDVNVIMQWVRFLSHIRVYAKKNNYKAVSKTLLDMNTISNYDMFLTDVFGADAPALMLDDYKAALNVGVVDAKLMVMKPPKKAGHYGDLDQAIADLTARADARLRPARVTATEEVLRMPVNWDQAMRTADNWLRTDVDVVTNGEPA